MDNRHACRLSMSIIVATALNSAMAVSTIWNGAGAVSNRQRGCIMAVMAIIGDLAGHRLLVCNARHDVRQRARR